VVGTILQTEIGDDPVPLLITTSRVAGGVARSWTTADEFMQEVPNARIYDGVHYRNSGRVGTEMGRQIAQLAIDKYLLKHK